ncbi:hypothetical protein HY995_01405 [Candidatus Micrarchaeota archaeon]|nr:hypothetical protein [Candidatus Micrarchaeota archaeon]
MSFKHWQWEAHALREKEKRPTVKEIASVLFENDTQRIHALLTCLNT